MAQLHPQPYPLPDPDYSVRYPQLDAHDQAFKSLLERSDALPEGQYVGKMIGWGRGDGTAWYLVTCMRPITLQWVPVGDAWQVEEALIRGLNRQDIKALSTVHSLPAEVERPADPPPVLRDESQTPLLQRMQEGE
jgi:hypothetical protein